MDGGDRLRLEHAIENEAGARADAASCPDRFRPGTGLPQLATPRSHLKEIMDRRLRPQVCYPDTVAPINAAG